ncbi:3-oxoacyl-[acyl-carrier-protein] synthase-3 [Dyadobacter sp. BE34]|uniref:3-oxoacyl-[acyl-carrier-protein] synthase-3 n=1 Tax=Dyadobacter fermentans TaxID=94254 RepID=A0ABU1R6W7_9BACT|nr:MULTISPECIES: beta-ketoacyl-ACP synthase III [Dyadobacter]MDR6809151.1 3-oxoacyl-[acyl-carrier-protein] synthase-3 [Dyadobacter fermentans]MDR7046894.1 3-oxoacyl-[acyl-carrier-protein] synthase-3 [Dyadobacter sp. BE242]MDR7201208.1 3-oxoacyl-[acyl-carrier-protein] synthase-3 [Dyadobacter sp. BE34]MDR7219168.1 3-oxoacyl-[acyl-carrier-protein] synthase-3 [Dyadobacter sp. BE31]MDR7264622.1 3-oxoacyl-[acyl-carrier-protein] synthase-3 [Dyadobacter sp. BE32]
MSEAYITRIAKFLPNESVSNEEMEEYLGYINGKPSKSKAIVLRNNGIKNRYYALRKDGTPTHTNAEMASLAIKGLFKNAPAEIGEMDLLSCATSSPDQLMPSHGSMVHGYLPEAASIEVVSPSGVCCAGMHAFKYAYMAVKLGEKQKAVACASERLSTVLRSDQFEDEVQQLTRLEKNPFLAFEKDFLRWMLSDGAGAFLVESAPNQEGISLKIDWIEGCSYANEVEACMYMGADKLEDGTLKSYKDFTAEEIKERSVLSIKQDVKLLGEKIVKLGFAKLKDILVKKGVTIEDVSYFLPHLSSYFFEGKIDEFFNENGMPIPKEKWYTNLVTKGNVGAASIYMMLEEVFNSGALKKGEKILLAVPESSRFSYMFCLLTVC